ncbi:enolase 4 isoform X2 [Clinocottus analis]|uniref:enolase 4 isoform X2 n=1 Tax=Clinocottus analis TaxID=304258 RepID=UPI0035C02C63
MSHRAAVSRGPAEQRDRARMSSAAAEFYRVNGVPQVIERVLNQLFVQEPEDVHGYLANYFTDLSAPPRISRLKGREVYDARGQLSIEAEVFCIVCNEEKSMSSASVSSLLGPTAALLDQKAGSGARAEHMAAALQWINGPLDGMLKDKNPCDQSHVDHILSGFFMARFLEEKDIRDKEKEEEEQRLLSEPEVPPTPTPTPNKKGGSKGKKSNTVEKSLPPAEPPEPVLPGSCAIGSVSLAVAKAAAKIQGVPLYKYIAALKNTTAPAQLHLPLPLVTLLSCGKTSPGKLSLLEEVILIPKAGPVKETITMTLELQKEMMRIINASTKVGATLGDGGVPTAAYERPEQPLDLIHEACDACGLAPGAEVHLALNCAAPRLMDYAKGKYEVATGALKSPDDLVEFYQTLIGKYPAVVALIDPFRGEDIDQWEKLSNVMEDSCALLSDVTFKSKARPLPGVKGHVLKHVHEMTISDLICIASEHQGSVLMGMTCSEPCSEDSWSDVVVGLGLNYIKLGGLSGAETMAKYNRMVSIEEELLQQGMLASQEQPLPPLSWAAAAAAAAEAADDVTDSNV